jgi:hypothetical protein
VLAFVGTKMLLDAFHIEIPVQLSLLVIVVVLGITTLLSLLVTAPDKGGREVEEGGGLEAFLGGADDGRDEKTQKGEPAEAGTKGNPREASDKGEPAGGTKGNPGQGGDGDDPRETHPERRGGG